MFPDPLTASDPKSAARVYVAALRQMFPNSSAKLERSLDFQIGIYPDQTDKQQWMRQARLSFKAKVRDAYPHVSFGDYPAWPQIVPEQIALSKTQEVKSPIETADVNQSEEQEEADDDGMNDAICALICEIEKTEDFHEGNTKVKAPERDWFHHAELGALLSEIDDQSALLRESAHKWAALLHGGFDLDCARHYKEDWQRGRERLDALWQRLEVLASDVAAGERIKIPRDIILDEEIKSLSALLERCDEDRRLSYQNCPDELQKLMARLNECVDESISDATLEEWISHWLEVDIVDAASLRHNLAALSNQIEALCERSLEDELQAIADSYKRPAGNNRSDQEETEERRNEMFRQRMGWTGEAARTLDDLSTEWRVSRERVRQIVKPLEDWVAERHFFTPVLSRVLDLVREQLPARTEDVVFSLQNSGIMRRLWSLESLSDTARSLGKEAGFALAIIEGAEKSQTLFLIWDGVNGASGKPLPQRLWQAITTHIWERGIGYWPDLQCEIADTEGEKSLALAAIILEHHAAVRWLDQSQGWFWLDLTRALRGQETRLLTPMVRALSVARQLSLPRLYAAVTRVHLHNTQPGYDWEMPPQQIFEMWCGSHSHFDIKNGEVEMCDTQDWREVLDNTEAMMIEIMEQNGPLLSRYNFRQLAAKRGIPDPTFYRYVDNLPTIEEIDDGVFALIGASISPQQLLEFHADYTNLPKRSQLRYGRLDDGNLWISYRINQGTINDGSLTLPKAMRGEFEGRYQLLNSRDVPVGNLSFNLTQCWGLRTYFSKQVSHGNRVTIIINKLRHQAIVFIGLTELPQLILDEVRNLEEMEVEDAEDE